MDTLEKVYFHTVDSMGFHESLHGIGHSTQIFGQCF